VWENKIHSDIKTEIYTSCTFITMFYIAFLYVVLEVILTLQLYKVICLLATANRRLYLVLSDFSSVSWFLCCLVVPLPPFVIFLIFLVFWDRFFLPARSLCTGACADSSEGPRQYGVWNSVSESLGARDMQQASKFVVRKPQEIIQLGRPRSRWGDNILTYLEEIEFQFVIRTQVLSTAQCLVHMNVEIKHRVSWE
jgi:hypothetical protein